LKRERLEFVQQALDVRDHVFTSKKICVSPGSICFGISRAGGLSIQLKSESSSLCAHEF
jgi:hypothetical protein